MYESTVVLDTFMLKLQTNKYLNLLNIYVCNCKCTYLLQIYVLLFSLVNMNFVWMIYFTNFFILFEKGVLRFNLFLLFIYFSALKTDLSFLEKPILLQKYEVYKKPIAYLNSMDHFTSTTY